LTEIMAFNDNHADTVMPWFGQDILAAALASELAPEEHAAALDAGRVEMQRRLDEVFAKFRLDFIVAPTNGPAWPIDVVLGDRFGVSSSGLAAISGRPAITLPAGQIHGLPIGISVVGKMWGDGQLLAMAFALEQLLPQAPRPGFLPSLEN
jgi:amidase